MKLLLTVMAVIALVGCSDRYRYPCQDPENWGKAECNAPICQADQSCTSMIFPSSQGVVEESTGKTTTQSKKSKKEATQCK